MIASTELERFSCEDYLIDKYREGHFDRLSQLQVVLSHEDVYLDGAESHLVVGFAGCDGIQLCYRAERCGLWAYFPLEDVYELKANTIKELIQGYCDGSISV